MKIGVVTFPGSNCNMDMVHALENNLGYNVVELWHKDSDLQNVDAVILPGGFSYGDYLRSGAIARFSNIMEEVVKFAVNGGKVLGSISQKLDLLIVGDNKPTKRKIEQAKKMKIKIITEKEWNKISNS